MNEIVEFQTNAQHTPGPWFVQSDDEHVVRSHPNGGDWIADAGSGRPHKYEENSANARLIAAAPELLKACLVVTEFLNALEAGVTEHDPLRRLRLRIHAPLRAALDPAIAKATATGQKPEGSR